jgi:nitrite reductase (NADH) large subunit
MSVKPRLVVVGHGMAAARVLEHLATIAPDTLDITVVGEEPLPGYNRILLSPVLSGEMTRDDIKLQDPEWYERHGMALQLGQKVTAIDRLRRKVRIQDGKSLSYDRLLLATGSLPIRLPLPGADFAGVATYRDLADTESLIAAAQPQRRAVVIGGGLLGLEAANGLAARGMEVTVVHLMPWLMERQLDREAAGAVQSRLEKRGIRFALARQTLAITGDGGRANGVEIAAAGTGNAELLEADIVVMAVGIRPNTALAEAAGLPVDRGILVNDTLQTNDPRIYAIGECVRHRGRSYGLVQPLYEMAKACATQLAGVGSHYYAGSIASTHLKVTGVDVFSAGDFAEAPGRENLVARDTASGIYRRLVLEGDRLIGGVLVGDSRGAARYTELIRSGQSIAPLRRQLMFLA